MENKRDSWGWGLAVFAATIVIMLFAFAPIQYALGLWGVAITELILLGIALGAAVLLRYAPKSVFPVKWVKLKQLAAIPVMMFATLAINVPLLVIVFYFFPEGYQLAEGFSQLFSSQPLPVAWLIVAVLPAICEEALHRGVLLRAFSSIQNKWAVIGLGGLVFGVFHLDPYRFLNTALMGAVLTYVMLKTENILLPMLFHLANNTLSVLSGQMSAQSPEIYAESLKIMNSPASIGIYLIYGAFGVVALRAGAALMVYQKPTVPPADPQAWLSAKKSADRSWLIAGGIALVLIIIGVALFANNYMELYEMTLHTA